jgi:YHS domain-containing protein
VVVTGILGGCAASGQAARPRPAEVTVRCPVSETDTDPRNAQTAQYGGKTYYFCCAGCKEAFEKDPERYANP